MLKIVNFYGYELKSQKGSHKKFSKNWKTVVIPQHKELKPKTVLSILKQIANNEWLYYKDIIATFKLKV